MTRVLLVTANVGSIFEDERLMTQWVSTLAESVQQSNPRFLALHCQEVGGKQEKRVTADRFVRTLLQSLPEFTNARVFLDNDPNAFTALGSVYLSRDLCGIWHFEDKAFVSVSDKTILSADVNTVTKRKFPSSVAEEAKSARKGYLHTRWRLSSGLVVDLVNVHLFHDACNLRAFAEFPSQFARIRRAALEWTLESVHNNEFPLFIFGDFNFRLDARAFIQRFTERSPTAEDENLVFKDSNDDLVVRIGRKTFEFREKEFFAEQFSSLRSLDKESNCFALHELPIAFPPSYPFGEDRDSGLTYMCTRCPAWCDRILFNRSAQSVVRDAHYWAVGASRPMGDHKPIALSARLAGSNYVRTNAGIFRETTI